MATEALCTTGEVGLGQVAPFSVVTESGETLDIALVHTENDQWYAVADRCTHGRVKLSEGFVEDTGIECARHGAVFDLATGNPLCPPASVPVKTYPVTVVDNIVSIEIN